MDIFSKLNKIIIIIVIIIIVIIIIIIIDIIIIAKRSINTSRLYTPISIKVAPVNHVSWPAVTMVNPFVAGSSVLLAFIETMETICEEAFKRTFNSNGCENAQA